MNDDLFPMEGWWISLVLSGNLFQFAKVVDEFFEVGRVVDVEAAPNAAQDDSSAKSVVLEDGNVFGIHAAQCHHFFVYNPLFAPLFQFSRRELGCVAVFGDAVKDR